MQEGNGCAISPRVLRHGVVIVLVVAVSLLITTPYFNVLDDEFSIITAAREPLKHTLDLFLSGPGQHEHPPFTDILLHLWLPVAGSNLYLVRLPFILCYATGLLVLALIAGELCEEGAFYATCITGALWPYGFHFGRLAGWYTMCFLEIALLTLAYLRFLRRPHWSGWLIVIAVGWTLVVSNYFGWAVLALLFVDIFFAIPIRIAWKYVAAGAAILIVSYGPLWPYFIGEAIYHDSGSGESITAQLANTAFNGYALFVSESFAPWYWLISIPVCAAIFAVLVLTPLRINGTVRRIYLGFWLQFLVMSALNILNTKRLLFFSCWLLIAIGCAVSDRSRPRQRLAFVGSLCVIAIVGWSGIIARSFYSAAHFIEPWPAVAKSVTAQTNQEWTIISNNGPFLFDLNADLEKAASSKDAHSDLAHSPQVISVITDPLTEGAVKGMTLLVRGVNNNASERTANAETWLKSHCGWDATIPVYREPEYELKRRLFPNRVGVEYRILIERYSCPSK